MGPSTLGPSLAQDLTVNPQQPGGVSPQDPGLISGGKVQRLDHLGRVVGAHVKWIHA